MRICVLGLGYVGAVSAACLARDGHEVVGVDPERTRVTLLNAGRAPIVEKDLDGIIAAQVAAGRLRALTEPAEAVRGSDLVLVCVGTPGLANGAIDLRYVRRACEQVGAALATHPGAPVVAMRSTVLPGTLRELALPILERCSGKRAGEEFGLCANPQFLREGSAVHDFAHPPVTLIGQLNRASGELLAGLHASTPGPLIRTDLETAEMVKYAANAWQALKVGFANEVGTLCRALGVDAHAAMEIFCQDRTRNLSPSHLRPGFAFGGGCLPKDLRALLYRASTLDVGLPILSAVLPSNRLQIERGVQAVVEKGRRRVGILGLSFKAGTDDLRESPVLELAERLVGKGYELRIYERCVGLSCPPHLSPLMVPSVQHVLAHAQTVVIGNASPEFADVPGRLGEGQSIIDLVRVCGSRDIAGLYEGVCW